MVTLGDTLAGRYALQDVLGRGGVATVYRAVDELLGRTVAIKVLTSQEHSRVEELRVEARLLAAIQHPNVVAVHDVIEHDDATFLVLELAEGTDLATLLNTHGPLDPADVVRIVGDVAAALDAAHARGVLHRDVKPANVVVDDDGRARVTDFGIGRFTTDDVTTGLHVRGSVAYVAPERLLGRSSDRAVDVYALAAVALEALTGQPPFPASVPTEAARSHVEQAPPAASSRRPELPAAVDAVIHRGLAKDPADRWPTAGDFAEALEEALTPGMPWRRVGWFAGAALAVATVAALLAGGDVSTDGDGPSASSDDGALPTPSSADSGATPVGAPGLVVTPSPSTPTPPADSPTVDATPESEDPSTQPSTSETPSEQPPETVDEAAARFRADLASGRADGRVSRRAVDDLEQKLADVLDAVERGQDRRVEQRLEDLRERIDHWARRNELDVDLANELDRRSRDLEEVALGDR